MRLPRIGAVIRKEVREFRRNRFVISTMAVMPFIFLVIPMVTLFRVPASASGATVTSAVGALPLLLLIVPIVIPPVIAAYSVVGERDQGTLEPVLTAPVRASELLLGKAAAAFVPSVGIAYAIYFIAAISIRYGAAHAVSVVVWHAPQMLAQILFTPLLALWAIWVGIGISTRASDVRVAQQLATLAGLPLLAFTSLISFQLITPSVPLVIGLALALLAADIAAWRVVSQLFDSERLLTGPRPPRRAPIGPELKLLGAGQLLEDELRIARVVEDDLYHLVYAEGCSGSGGAGPAQGNVIHLRARGDDLVVEVERERLGRVHRLPESLGATMRGTIEEPLRPAERAPRPRRPPWRRSSWGAARSDHRRSFNLPRCPPGNDRLTAGRRARPRRPPRTYRSALGRPL